jgi:hypothetical protein
MAHIVTYLRMTSDIPAGWPVMIPDPAADPTTGEVTPGGLINWCGNLAVRPTPMTVGQTRDVAAAAAIDGLIVIGDGRTMREQRTEFVIEPDRERVVIGGWDWATRTYLTTHYEGAS